MPVNREVYLQLRKELESRRVTLVAVSKTKPAADILELYQLGHRDFGENYVQELAEKAGSLPAGIHWHFIGHLQSNKVKYIAPFVHLIHGVDSFKLLQEINKQALRSGRMIDCLLQVHIAKEETKFGLNESELDELIAHYASGALRNVRIRGLMGMASFTGDEALIKGEFSYLKTLFEKYRGLPHFEGQFSILSMGMSSDYKIAVEEGSTLVRIGSLLFGPRT